MIDNEGLKRPISSEVVSLIYDAWKNPDGESEKEILKILRSNWLWEFTGNFYLPKSNDEINNGIIIEYNPKIVNENLAMNKSSLIKRLKENDPNVKFVPFGFKIGEQNHLEFSKNKYIVARYGEEGAEKISEVSLKYKRNPYIHNFSSVDEEKQRISTLGVVFSGDELIVIGDYWGDINICNSFGVLKK